MSRVLVSSAYRKNFKIFEEFFMSFIYNKKRMGPRILPCGHHILFASYQTKCHLFLLFGVYFSVMKNRHQIVKIGDTVSNALAKSRKTLAA